MYLSCVCKIKTYAEIRITLIAMSPVHFHPSISDESAPSTQSENIPQPAAYSAQMRKVKQTAAGRFAGISGRGQNQLEFELKYKIGVHESGKFMGVYETVS